MKIIITGNANEKITMTEKVKINTQKHWTGEEAKSETLRR